MARAMEGDGRCVMETQTLGREGWSRPPHRRRAGGDPGKMHVIWRGTLRGWEGVRCEVAGLCGTSALGCSSWSCGPSSCSQDLALGGDFPS